MPHAARHSQAEVPSITSYGQVIEYIEGTQMLPHLPRSPSLVGALLT